MTESEAHLARLCRRTFLHLWSYPGLYQDKGKGKTGHGKELCDLLVVFGNDMLFFSDKHCELRLDPTPEIGWARWYRKAIVDAANQIASAERWLASNPSRVFVDRACSERIPIALPATQRTYRIVTCRGAAKPTAETVGGRGSLIVTNGKLSEGASAPFHLGAIDEAGRFFHVFDEVALEALLATFDTATDLCEYLADREEFFRTYERVVAAGEEELIAFYLRNFSEERGRHCFHVEVEPSTGMPPSAVIIDEGYWDEWLPSAARASKIAADEVSYCWDRLIEKFSYHVQTATQDYASPGGISVHEVIVRWMAKEPRVRRRMLSRALVGMIHSDKPDTLHRKLILPSQPGDPYWVLCAFPQPSFISPAQYREGRRAVLDSLCRAAKHAQPQALDIAGIAIGPNLAMMSEDLVHLDAREWNEEAAADAAEASRVMGAFSSDPTFTGVEYEFPTNAPAMDPGAPAVLQGKRDQK